MGLYQTLLSRAVAADGCLLPDWQRLLQLENAVLNYGGGLPDLVARVEARAARHQQDCPDTAALLAEIARYLRDVAQAGQLDLRDTATFLRETLP